MTLSSLWGYVHNLTARCSSGRSIVIFNNIFLLWRAVCSTQVQPNLLSRVVTFYTVVEVLIERITHNSSLRNVTHASETNNLSLQYWRKSNAKTGVFLCCHDDNFPTPKEDSGRSFQSMKDLWPDFERWYHFREFNRCLRFGCYHVHLARHTCMTNPGHKIWRNHPQPPCDGGNKSTGLSRAAGSWGRPGKLRVSSRKRYKKRNTYRIHEDFRWYHSIEVDICLNV